MKQKKYHNIILFHIDRLLGSMVTNTELWIFCTYPTRTHNGFPLT